MRFSANFTPLIKILLWVMFGLSVAAVVVCILVLCGVPVPPLTKGQSIPLLFSTSIVAVFSATLATLHYKVTATHLRLNVAFFDVLGGRIALKNLLNIVIRTETENGKPQKKMYVSYLWQGSDPVIARIAIRPAQFEKMKQALLLANENIVVFDDDNTEGEQ